MSVLNTLILNRANWSKEKSSTLEFNFPTPQKFDGATDTIALQSLSMYNSMYNIESVRGNNRVTLKFPKGDGTWLTYNWTIPDSFMDVSTLNDWFKQQQKREGLILNDDKGESVLFFEIGANSAQYSVEVRCFRVLTQSEMTAQNLTYPATHEWTAPTTLANAYTPQVIFNSAFGSLIGHSGGTLPRTPVIEDTIILSDLIPQIAPVYSILFGCNLVSSDFSTDNNQLFYSTPVQVKFGGMISVNPNSLLPIPIRSGQYSKLEVSLFDPEYTQLRIHDKDIVLVLVLNKKK